VLLLLALVYLSTALVPLHRAETIDQRIDGEYIGFFSASASKQTLFNYMSQALSSNISNFETFEIYDVRGAFFTLTDLQLEDHLKRDDVFDFISENRIVTINQACARQTGAIWNLERVSEINIDLSNRRGYQYSSSAGYGVTSYIIDTGILITHNEFAGRASWGTNAVGDGRNTDCQGHGTHVAGTVGGRLYGVAKSVELVAVKVLNCQGSGTTQSVVRGIQWVTSNARRPANANMSLGGGNDPSIRSAVEASIRSGIPYAVAAGNDNSNACNYSPANVGTAISTGATALTGTGSNAYDTRSTFSNWGTCVHMFAPGTSITSAWIGSNSATNTISGTSMASPHIAGALSLLQAVNPNASPAQLKSDIISWANNNMITLNCGSAACNQSPNRLLYTARC
jgi:subtilisin family serine protease